MSSIPEPAEIDLKVALQEIERLESVNAELSADLEDCKDQLFALVLKSNDTPEQAIKDAFVRIFSGIESWIDDISGEEQFQSNFEAQYQQNLRSSARKTYFEDIGLDAQCCDPVWQAALGRNANCHYVILSLLIGRWLVDEVLVIKSGGADGSKFYPFGLSENHIECIQEAENALNSASEDGDISKSAKWRSQTISALSSTDNFQITLDNQLRRASEYLSDQMAEWVGNQSLLDEHFPALQKKVLGPAVELVRMAACSNKTYTLSFPGISPGQFPKEVNDWGFKNAQSWRTVIASDLVGPITCLYPGIIRKGSGDQDDLLLVNPVALRYSDPELQPRASW